MNSPCEKSGIIEEISRDVKELLKFKNMAMGIITASRVIMLALVGFIGWAMGMLLK